MKDIETRLLDVIVRKPIPCRDQYCRQVWGRIGLLLCRYRWYRRPCWTFCSHTYSSTVVVLVARDLFCYYYYLPWKKDWLEWKHQDKTSKAVPKVYWIGHLVIVWSNKWWTSNWLIHNRNKEKIWVPIAQEMGISWRVVEALYWQMGEQELANRA